MTDIPPTPTPTPTDAIVVPVPAPEPAPAPVPTPAPVASPHTADPKVTHQLLDQTFKAAIVAGVAKAMDYYGVDPAIIFTVAPVLYAVLAFISHFVGDPGILSFFNSVINDLEGKPGADTNAPSGA